jgi:hypothetical protein
LKFTAPVSVRTAEVARFLCAVLFLLFARDASADVEFKITDGDTVVPNAEVCFYPFEFPNPFSAFRSNGEMHCLPASEHIRIPRGTWSVFAQERGKPRMSGHAVLSGDEGEDPGLRRRRMQLLPAASIDVRGQTLAAGEAIVILTGETETSRPSVIPIAHDASTVIVPAITRLVPVRLKDGKPVAIGTPFVASVGAHASLAPVPSRSRAVMVVFSPVDPSGVTGPPSTKFLQLLLGQELPKIEIHDAGGRTYQSVTASINAANLMVQLYVFPSVPPGKATVSVSGGRWLPSVTQLDVPESETVVTRLTPIPIELGGTLHVQIDRGDMPAILATPATCESDAVVADDRDLRVKLLRCPMSLSQTKLTGDIASHCRGIVEKDLKESVAAAEFTALKDDELLLTVEQSGRVLFQGATHPRRGADVDEHVQIRPSFVSGRVTRKGQPVAATVAFLTGSAVSSPFTGEYVAVLPELPGRSPVKLTTCDGTNVYVYVPAAPVPNGAGYDISIPSAELEIAVEDSATGKRLPDATAWVAALRQDDPNTASFQLPALPKESRLIVDSLDTGISLQACAMLVGYEKGCNAPFLFREDGQTTSVRLRKSGTAHRGHITVAGYSRAFFTLPDGTLTEQAMLNEAGDFEYQKTHQSPEQAVFVGATMPLFVSSLPSLVPEPWEVTPIPVPARSFVVAIDASVKQESAVLGLVVDRVRIPDAAFGTHQRLRRNRFVIVNKEPVRIADVGGNTVEVILGPDPMLLTPGSDGSLIPSSIALGLPRLPVTGANVTFR